MLDMLNYIWQFFKSPFDFSTLSPLQTLMSIILAFVFGFIWLSAYWPWPKIIKKPFLWLVLLGGAFITWIVVALIQISFQYWINKFFGNQTSVLAILLLYLPLLGVSALVQQSSKLLPVWLWKRFKEVDISPKMGLIVGAISGCGFGIIEAIAYNNIFLSSGSGWMTLAGTSWLLERFFYISFHIASSAFVGYNLAKGNWLKPFFIAVALQLLILYFTPLAFYLLNFLPSTTLIILADSLIGIATLSFSGFVLWTLWKKLQAKSASEQPISK